MQEIVGLRAIAQCFDSVEPNDNREQAPSGRVGTRREALSTGNPRKTAVSRRPYGIRKNNTGRSDSCDIKSLRCVSLRAFWPLLIAKIAALGERRNKIGLDEAVAATEQSRLGFC